MRSSTSSLHATTLKRPLPYAHSDVETSEAFEAWHSRALRDTATVRRALRGAHAGHFGVVAITPTMDALEHGAVEELLITPRFIDSNSDASAKALQLAGKSSARVSVLSGAAAFELDLVAGGIGAILRRLRAL